MTRSIHRTKYPVKDVTCLSPLKSKVMEINNMEELTEFQIDTDDLLE